MASVRDACARQADGGGDCPWGVKEIMALYNELQPGVAPGGDDSDDDDDDSDDDDGDGDGGGGAAATAAPIDPDVFAAAAFKHGLFFPPEGRVVQVRDLAARV